MDINRHPFECSHLATSFNPSRIITKVRYGSMGHRQLNSFYAKWAQNINKFLHEALKVLI